MKITNNMANQRLGKILLARRISKGLSQADVAKGSNLSLDFVIKVEQGKGWLNLDDLLSLNRVLKYRRLSDLFEEAGL